MKPRTVALKESTEKPGLRCQSPDGYGAALTRGKRAAASTDYGEVTLILSCKADAGDENSDGAGVGHCRCGGRVCADPEIENRRMELDSRTSRCRGVGQDESDSND